MKTGKMPMDERPCIELIFSQKLILYLGRSGKVKVICVVEEGRNEREVVCVGFLTVSRWPRGSCSKSHCKSSGLLELRVSSYISTNSGINDINLTFKVIALTYIVLWPKCLDKELWYISDAKFKGKKRSKLPNESWRMPSRDRVTLFFVATPANASMGFISCGNQSSKKILGFASLCFIARPLSLTAYVCCSSAFYCKALEVLAFGYIVSQFRFWEGPKTTNFVTIADTSIFV
jgi:hypothetical protein